MVDILHRVGVKGASPEEVYDALTTVEGLAGWEFYLPRLAPYVATLQLRP